MIKSKVKGEKKEVKAMRRHCKNSTEIYRTTTDAGFTLIEMIIVVAMLAVLMGIMVPSLNPIGSFRAQRAAAAITSALDETRTEATSRLVAEMVLSKNTDGYYITQYLYRGKQAGLVAEEPEKIGPRTLQITYTTNDGTVHDFTASGESSLILTFDRDSGSLRAIQREVLKSADIQSNLDQKKNISYKDKYGSGNYCTDIRITTNKRIRIITLEQGTGRYSISSEIIE